jgi:uncharacterized membrane protein (DUF2068 family)
MNQRHGVAVGLVVLGAIKIVGGYGLLRRRAWGYYLLVTVLVVLLTIELVHVGDAHSAFSIVVALVNALVLALLLVFRQRFIHH